MSVDNEVRIVSVGQVGESTCPPCIVPCQSCDRPQFTVCVPLEMQRSPEGSQTALLALAEQSEKLAAYFRQRAAGSEQGSHSGLVREAEKEVVRAVMAAWAEYHDSIAGWPVDLIHACRRLAQLETQ